MADSRTSAYICDVCGSVYADAGIAAACAGHEPEAETIATGSLVRPLDAGAGTGLGWVTGSFLLGMGDPRGEAHVRYYRASFLWGRADFLASDLEAIGVVTESEWREAVARGEQ